MPWQPPDVLDQSSAMKLHRGESDGYPHAFIARSGSETRVPSRTQASWRINMVSDPTSRARSGGLSPHSLHNLVMQGVEPERV